MPKYEIGQTLTFSNQPVVVQAVEGDKYYCEIGKSQLPMWLPERMLENSQPSAKKEWFNRRPPHMLIIDRFYQNPDEIREIALEQKFVTNKKFYKGQRTEERFLWPFLKEEFERLLGLRITDWMNQRANGCFQITNYKDPLVWHSDRQDYAAAIYLTPDAPIGAGTSFWRDRKHGCRRPSNHPLETDRFPDDATRNTVLGDVYNGHSILNPEGWELVDKVGAVYNRLVIWDAQLIHSASSYEGLSDATADKSRLVQLFFFSVKQK